jgi:Flp pilus assembly protein TadD
MGTVDGDWRTIAHAEQLLDLRRYAEAEQRFRDVVATQPESVDGLLGLARALHAQDRDDEAEAAARSAVALDPERGGSYHVLVDILCAGDDPAPAVRAAERALALEPHDYLSHYQLARARLIGRRPEVYRAYGSALRAVELAPHSASTHNLVGVCLDRLGDAPAAEQAFRNALAIDPHHTLAQTNLAASDLESGKLGRAARRLRSAVGADPQEKRTRDHLDLVLVVLGRRVMWSLLVAAIVMGALLVNEAPWWSRALAGTAYAAVLSLVVRGVVRELPRGVGRWGRGLFGRVDWRAKYLIGLLALLSGAVLLMAYAPYEVAAGAGIVLVAILRTLGLICIVGWIVMAGVNLVRGK